jgi:proline dehydrogenase
MRNFINNLYSHKLTPTGSNHAPQGATKKAGKHGNPDYNKAIDDAIEKLPKEAKDVRKNQVQVDINGNKVGNNRPDIQYNKDGKHHNVEVDRNIRNRNDIRRR